MIQGPYPRTQAWYDLRKFNPDRQDRPVVFGATEAAAACGLSPYSTPLDLYLRKRGESPEFEGNEATEMGLLLEPLVIKLYAKRAVVIVKTELPMFLSDEHPFLAATPDAIATPVTEDDNDWGVDAKTSTYRRYDEFAGVEDEKFGAEGTDQLPTDYVLQGQQQMAVLGLDRVDFPVLFDGRTLRTYRVDRNDDLIDAIISAEKELSERIVNGDPPEPTWSHKNTRKAIERVFGIDAGKVTELTPAELELWNEYQRLGVTIKEAESKREECRNRLLWEMRDAELGRFPSGTKELRRIVVQESRYTEADLAKIQQRMGQVKRARYERLMERKVKK